MPPRHRIAIGLTAAACLAGGPAIAAPGDGDGDGDPPRTFGDLAVSLAGRGTGHVTGADRYGEALHVSIDCPDRCTESYPTGEAATLRARPDPGSRFAGWAGACTGLAECRFTMAAATTVTATFAPVPDGFSGLRLTPTTFHAATRRNVAAGLRTGTTVAWYDSRAGAVTLLVERTAPGRRVGGLCAGPGYRPRPRTGARCTAVLDALAPLDVDDVPGRNTLALDGRIDGTALAPGHYRLRLTARGRRERVAAFTVLR